MGYVGNDFVRKYIYCRLGMIRMLNVADPLNLPRPKMRASTDLSKVSINGLPLHISKRIYLKLQVSFWTK
jgi:hypothetical protein